jgi:hypothetical protein
MHGSGTFIDLRRMCPAGIEFFMNSNRPTGDYTNNHFFFRLAHLPYALDVTVGSGPLNWVQRGFRIAATHVSNFYRAQSKKNSWLLNCTIGKVSLSCKSLAIHPEPLHARMHPTTIENKISVNISSRQSLRPSSSLR